MINMAKWKYGILFLISAVVLAFIVDLVMIFKMGRIIAAPFSLVMFYITLFLAFAILFGAIGFLAGTIIGLIAEKIKR